MSERELVALGTGSLVPTRDRNQSGCFLRWGPTGVLFDPGEGAQRQMTLAGISARRIRIICLTHLHGDHCLGLPGVLQRISLDQVPHPVTLVYPASGQEYVDRLRAASIYHDRADPHLLAGEGGAGRRGDGVGQWACVCSREGIFLVERAGRAIGWRSGCTWGRVSSRS